MPTAQLIARTRPTLVRREQGPLQLVARTQPLVLLFRDQALVLFARTLPLRLIRQAFAGLRAGVGPSRVTAMELRIPEGFLAGTEAVWINTVRQTRVASPSAANEYAVGGSAITLAQPITAADRVWVDYWVPGGNVAPRVGVPVSILTPTSGLLPETPVPGSDRVFVGWVPQRRVSSGPQMNEYVISGASIVFGFDVSGLPVWADYTVPGVPAAPKTGVALAQNGPTELELPEDPVVDSVALYVNNAPLERVASSPVDLQFSVAGRTITTGISLNLGGHDRAFADYWTA
jgi:hypothetical protein